MLNKIINFHPNIAMFGAFLLVLTLVASACWSSYAANPPVKVATEDSKERFEQIYVNTSLYWIKDHETGKQYLSRVQGGFIEVTPKNP